MPPSDAVKVASPTLPLPPPIAFSDLIETATSSVNRALDARALNPQPLPPGTASPFTNGRIVIGIIFEPQLLQAAAAAE